MVFKISTSLKIIKITFNYFTDQMHDKTLPIFEAVNPQRTGMGPPVITGGWRWDI